MGRNIIGGQFLVDSEQWVVSLIRDTQSNNPYHVQLIIEGVESGTGQGVLKLADLVMKSPSDTAATTFKGHSANLSAGTPSGMAEIRFTDISFPRLQARFARGSLRHESWSLKPTERTALMAAIQQDVGRDIPYNQAGDARGWSAVFSLQEYHNCLSWAEAQLRQAGLDVPEQRDWCDFIVKVPTWHLPDDASDLVESDNRTSGMCLTM